MSRAQKTILCLGFIVLLLVLAPLALDTLLGGRNQAYLDRLKSQGEPLSLEQLQPPAVPEFENSAETFLRADVLLKSDISLLQSNKFAPMNMVAPGRATACSQARTAVGSAGTYSWEELERALALNQPAIGLLQTLAEHPQIGFRIPYGRPMVDGFDLASLHLVELKHAGNYLSAAIVCGLHDGDLADVFTNVKALFALGKAAQFERTDISDMIGRAILTEAQSASWEILQSTNATEAQLAALQNEWQEVDYVRNWRDTLEMERYLSELDLNYLRGAAAGPGFYLGYETNAASWLGTDPNSETMFGKIREDGGVFIWRYWQSYPDEMRFLQEFQVVLTAARYVATNGHFQVAISNQAAGLAALRFSSKPAVTLGLSQDFRAIFKESAADEGRFFERLMAVEAGRQVTVAAIALQRFKLANGHYPAQLSDLVPQYLPNVPPDPVDGRPLRYRLPADGKYLLYSVGKDGVDNGGNPAHAAAHSDRLFWLDSDALDWVWPQAAERTNDLAL